MRSLLCIRKPASGLHQRPIQSTKSIVWCGVRNAGITEYRFYEKEVKLGLQRLKSTMSARCVFVTPLNCAVDILTPEKRDSDNMGPRPIS